jgi:hypothetical protein
VAAEYNAGDIEAQLGLNREPFEVGIDAAIAKGEEIEKKGIHVPLEVEVDPAEVEAAFDEIKAMTKAERGELALEMGVDITGLSRIAASNKLAAIQSGLEAQAQADPIEVPVKADVDVTSGIVARNTLKAIVSGDPLQIQTIISQTQSLTGERRFILDALAKVVGVEDPEQFLKKSQVIQAILEVTNGDALGKISEVKAAALTIDDLEPMININTSIATAKIVSLDAMIAGLKAEILLTDLAGGAGGAGGGIVAAASKAGGYGSGPAGTLIASIPASLAGIAAGTSALHLALSAIPIAISAASAAVGGGLLAAGALGTAAVGFGTDLAGVGQAVGDISSVEKVMAANQAASPVDIPKLTAAQASAQATYNTDQAQLAQIRSTKGGSNSPAEVASLQQEEAARKSLTSATTALTAAQRGSAAQQAALNTALAGFNPVARSAVSAAAQQIITFKALFDQYTGVAEEHGAEIINTFVKTGEAYLPVIGKFATENTEIIQKGLEPFFAWLKDPSTWGGLGIFTNLEQIFQKSLPTAVHAGEQAFELFAKTIDIAAQYSGSFITKLDDFFTKFNGPDFGRWETEIQKLIGYWHTWGAFFHELFAVLHDMLDLEAHTGIAIIEQLTRGLADLDKWLKGIDGSTLGKLFTAHKEQIMDLLQMFGILIADVGPSLIQLFTTIAKEAGPIMPVIGEALGTILPPLIQLLNLLLEIPGIGNLIAVFLVLEGFKSINGRWFGAIGRGFSAMLYPIEKYAGKGLDYLLVQLGELTLKLPIVGALMTKLAESSLLKDTAFGKWVTATNATNAGTPVAAEAAAAGTIEEQMEAGGGAAGQTIRVAMTAAGLQTAEAIGEAIKLAGMTTAAEVGEVLDASGITSGEALGTAIRLSGLSTAEAIGNAIRLAGATDAEEIGDAIKAAGLMAAEDISAAMKAAGLTAGLEEGGGTAAGGGVAGAEEGAGGLIAKLGLGGAEGGLLSKIPLIGGLLDTLLPIGGAVGGFFGGRELAKHTETSTGGQQGRAGRDLTGLGGGLLGGAAGLAATGVGAPVAVPVALVGGLVTAAGEITSHWATVEGYLSRSWGRIEGGAKAFGDWWTESLPHFFQVGWGAVASGFDAFSNWWTVSFPNAFVSGFDHVTNLFDNWRHDMIHWFDDGKSWLVNAGKAVVGGFIKGLEHYGDDVKHWAGDFKHDVLSTVDKIFGIASPASSTIPAGVAVVQGITVGMQQESGAAIKAAAQISEQISKSFGSLKVTGPDAKAISNVASIFGSLASMFKDINTAAKAAAIVTKTGDITTVEAALTTLAGQAATLDTAIKLVETSFTVAKGSAKHPLVTVKETLDAVVNIFKAIENASKASSFVTVGTLDKIIASLNNMAGTAGSGTSGDSLRQALWTLEAVFADSYPGAMAVLKAVVKTMDAVDKIFKAVETANKESSGVTVASLDHIIAALNNMAGTAGSATAKDSLREALWTAETIFAAAYPGAQAVLKTLENTLGAVNKIFTAIKSASGLSSGASVGNLDRIIEALNNTAGTKGSPTGPDSLRQALWTVAAVFADAYPEAKKVFTSIDNTLAAVSKIFDAVKSASGSTGGASVGNLDHVIAALNNIAGTPGSATGKDTLHQALWTAEAVWADSYPKAEEVLGSITKTLNSVNTIFKAVSTTGSTASSGSIVHMISSALTGLTNFGTALGFLPTIAAINVNPMTTAFKNLGTQINDDITAVNSLLVSIQKLPAKLPTSTGAVAAPGGVSAGTTVHYAPTNNTKVINASGMTPAQLTAAVKAGQEQHDNELLQLVGAQ